MVPETRTKTEQVCVCDDVPETKTESYVVRVPKKVTKQQCFQVRKCVEEEVPADECGDASNGAGAGHGGKGGRGCLRGCKKGC